MAAAHGATAMKAQVLTAIDLLTQRQHEDWICAWDDQGNLRPELTAQSIATAALSLRDWLAQQDWSGCHADERRGGDRAPASAGYDERIELSIQKQSIRASAIPQQDGSDHLISPPIVLLAISDPAHFLIWFSAISSLNYPTFLGNPTWGLDHWQQVQEGLTPHLIITDSNYAFPPACPWRIWAVENLPYLWEKQDFPQVLTACGKWIDPNDHQGLSHLRPNIGFPQPVESGWIGIPTGGSSGQLRFALHSWNSLTASVSGLQKSELTAESGVINSCCTLPLHHVSGLMQFLRSLLSGGKFWLLPWSLIKANFHLKKLSSIGNQMDASSSALAFWGDLDQFFLSLVPTQLQRLLEKPSSEQLLVQFYTILLGGAPAWPALLEQAKNASIRLAPTYGMTETASQVITLHPDDFLRGQLGCGKLLPHAQVDWLASSNESNNNLCIQDPSQGEMDASGLLRIRSHSLALGYYAIRPLDNERIKNQTSRYGGSLELWAGQTGVGKAARSFVTDDLGYCDSDGYFYIIGRASDKIISGGENVFPAAVEAAILATGLVKDVVVLGLADSTWGERVVAVVVPGEALGADELEETDSFTTPLPSQSKAEWAEGCAAAIATQIAEGIASILSPAQRPKQWLLTDAIPRNAQGKIQRQQLRDWAMAQEQGGLTGKTKPAQR